MYGTWQRSGGSILKNILITGGMGFLGYNLAKFFNQLGYTIYGIGHYHSTTLLHNTPFKEWKTAPINLDELKNMEIEKLDYVFHCGGSGSVGQSFTYPMLDYQKTVSGTLHIFEYLRIYHPNAHIIYPSSVAVIGTTNEEKISEKTQGKPISPYGYHKKIAEEICEEYSQIFNIKSSIIRLFSIYGLGNKKQFLWDCVQKIKKNTREKQINLFGTGEEIRDYIHILDVAEIFESIIKYQTSFFEIYNGGSGEGKKIKDLASLIASIMEFEGKIVFEQTNHQGDPQCYLADIQKISSTLGFQPKQNFIEQLNGYIQWAKKQ